MYKQLHHVAWFHSMASFLCILSSKNEHLICEELTFHLYIVGTVVK